MIVEQRLYDYRSIINELVPFLIVQNLSCSSEPVKNSVLEKTIEVWVHNICGETAIGTDVEFKSYELRPFTFYEALASLQGIKNGIKNDKQNGTIKPIIKKAEKQEKDESAAGDPPNPKKLAGYQLENISERDQKQLKAEIDLLYNICEAICDSIEKMRSKLSF